MIVNIGDHHNPMLHVMAPYAIKLIISCYIYQIKSPAICGKMAKKEKVQMWTDHIGLFFNQYKGHLVAS